MGIAAQLLVLAAAHGDPARLALATVDIAYPALADAEREALKEALEAAAVPHWCDEAVLAALLGVPAAEAAARLARLRGLNVVEAFRARGEGAINVHEATRLMLRRRMALGRPAQLRELSARAAACFAGDRTPAARIEWLYHLLCADPERGAVECDALVRDWSLNGYPEDTHALALALDELAAHGMVAGRARAEALLGYGEFMLARGEGPQLRAIAVEALEIARQAGAGTARRGHGACSATAWSPKAGWPRRSRRSTNACASASCWPGKTRPTRGGSRIPPWRTAGSAKCCRPGNRRPRPSRRSASACASAWRWPDGTRRMTSGKGTWPRHTARSATCWRTCIG